MRKGAPTQPTRPARRSATVVVGAPRRYTGMYMTKPDCTLRPFSWISRTLPEAAAAPLSRARSMAARRVASVSISKPSARKFRPVNGSIWVMEEYSGRGPGGLMS